MRFLLPTSLRLTSLLLFVLAGAGAVLADTAGPSAVAKVEDGEYFDKAGNPTYHIGSKGKVDWYTFSGYRRFNGACEVCHGFDGAGSSFAPDLTASLKSLTYDQFTDIVINGRQNVSAAEQLVMPSFGTNKNVTCYLDDIYVYLRARSDGSLGTGRPAKHEAKPAAAAKAEDECMGPS